MKVNFYKILGKLSIFAIFFLFSLFLIKPASALSCTYNNNPYISPLGETINWICYSNYSTCFSYVTFNGSLIQLNPLPKYIEEYGVIDYFKVSGGMANIEFRSEDLRHNKTVEFWVKCDNETLGANITPLYKEFYEVIDRGAWLKDNAAYLVFGGIIIIIILVVVVMLWGNLRHALKNLLAVVFG